MINKETITELLKNPDVKVVLEDPREPSFEELSNLIYNWSYRFKELLSYDETERHIWFTSNNKTDVSTMHNWMCTGLIILSTTHEDIVDNIHKAITWFCQPISFTSENTKSQFDIFIDDNTNSLSITSKSDDVELLMVEDFIRELLILVNCDFDTKICKYASSLQEVKIYNSAVCGEDCVKFYERIFDYKNNHDDYEMMLKLVSESSALEREKMLLQFMVSDFRISNRVNDMFFYNEYDGKLYDGEQYIYKIKDIMLNNKNTIRKLLFKKPMDTEFINMYDYLHDTILDYEQKDDKYILYNNLLDIRTVLFVYKTDDCRLITYPFNSVSDDLSEDDSIIRILLDTLTIVFRELHTDENKPKYNYII